MKPLSPILLLLTAGCISEPSEYFYGVDLAGIEFVVQSPKQGVWPDSTVLNIEENPFALTGVSQDQAWELLAAGQMTAAWYAWATVLTVEAYGQPQYNSAFIAHEIYNGNLADDEDLVWIREIAVGGYTVMLEEWPDSRQYSADGSYSWPLAPLAYEGLLSLGGSVEGFALVETVDGEYAVVPQ